MRDLENILTKSEYINEQKQDPLRLQDRLRRQDVNQRSYDHLPHASLTGNILECCFEVMMGKG